MPAVAIENLTKTFAPSPGHPEPLKALDNVSTSIPQGCVCGILGPNGAGKTTLLRILSSILSFDAGQVSILGRPLSGTRSRQLMGYMPEERGLYPDMKVAEQIAYFAKLHGADPKLLPATIDRFLEMFNLSDERNRKLASLSKGNQQKIQIIATIAHKPKIVILDEPFSGFDPINSAILTDLIDCLRKEGTTLILSSHNMGAIEQVCDNILMINHGRLLVDGPVAEIRESHADGSAKLVTAAPFATDSLAELADVRDAATLPDRRFSLVISPKQGIANSRILAHVAPLAEIISFAPIIPSLTDIFLQYNSTHPQPLNTQ